MFGTRQTFNIDFASVLGYSCWTTVATFGLLCEDLSRVVVMHEYLEEVPCMAQHRPRWLSAIAHQHGPMFAV